MKNQMLKFNAFFMVCNGIKMCEDLPLGLHRNWIRLNTENSEIELRMFSVHTFPPVECNGNAMNLPYLHICWLAHLHWWNHTAAPHRPQFFEHLPKKTLCCEINKHEFPTFQTVPHNVTWRLLKDFSTALLFLLYGWCTWTIDRIKQIGTKRISTARARRIQSFVRFLYIESTWCTLNTAQNEI